MNKMFTPTGMNIELTTCCPLHCPQCYCTLEGGKHIPYTVAIKALHDAAKLGVEHVELSGGETLCYPHLIEIVSEAHKLGIKPNVALSGWQFTKQTLSNLVEAGIDGIYISLNAPTKEMNDITRDGFDLAINALEIIKKSNFPRAHINWVMHRQTAEYFPQMLELAKKYNARSIVILMPKPDSKHELKSFPTKEQMVAIAEYIKNNTDENISIGIESCFSQLLAIYNQNKFWGNLNRGPHKGCGAGIVALNVNVDGLYSPCRHLDFFEKHESMIDYWNNSQTLKLLRELDENPQEPCLHCEFKNNCRHCLAINAKIHNELYIGNEFCPIYEKKQ